MIFLSFGRLEMRKGATAMTKRQKFKTEVFIWVFLRVLFLFI